MEVLNEGCFPWLVGVGSNGVLLFSYCLPVTQLLFPKTLFRNIELNVVKRENDLVFILFYYYRVCNVGVRNLSVV